MLVIRAEQLRVLSSDVLERFRRAQAVAARLAHPGPCARLDTRALAAWIASAIRRAEAYGCDTRAHIARYVDLTFRLGLDFDLDETRPWAADVLCNPELPPALKLDLLEDLADRSAGEPRGG